MDSFLNKNTDVAPLRYRDKFDKYDYLTAIACGTISGLVDAFLVGSPGNSVLGAWTDEQAENCVKAFAKMNGWNPQSGNENNVKSAIRALENKFKVNYDQQTSASIDNFIGMSASNHHMKSLAHSPSPIGLLFSLINQFTSTSAFLSDGRLIWVDTETFELQGGNFVSKLFCGIANWIGHLFSDVAGSSTSKGRGSGIIMPFYELFNLCNFGSIDVNGTKKTIADLATNAFESGYDLRFGAAMAIPVILCEVTIRLIWGIRRYFQYKKPLNECIPTMKHDDLRVMLLIGHGSLCLVDGVDAIIRSGGNPLNFVLHLNLVGWCRLIKLAIKEVCIRVGLDLTIQGALESMKRVNQAAAVYLAELERIDIEAYRREAELWDDTARIIESASDEDDLNIKLKGILNRMGLEVQWEKTHDSFDSFMLDENTVLSLD